MDARQSFPVSGLPETVARPGPARPSRPAQDRARRTSPRPRRDDVTIRVESSDVAETRVLIDESQSELLRHLPADEIFSLAHADLAAPNITLFVARIDGQAAGCVALLDAGTYGEVKRLFIRDRFRRTGVAQALMTEVEQFCRDVGLLRVKLETSPLLRDAHTFYAGIGYQACAPFGDYPVLDSSLFMEKELGTLR